jgi:3-oxoacid CoA-transferase B subunit
MTIGLTKEAMARRAARAIPDGSIVNLGIGTPSLVGDFLPPERDIWVQVENGALGIGPRAAEGEEDLDLINASREYVTLRPGGSYFHHADSFALIRGGHVDVSVMGGLQVSERGDLANWSVPGAVSGGIGGAMDLAAGAKQVFVLMSHVTREGEPKVLRECTYPLTARRVVSLIITDLALIEVAPEGLFLRERAPDVTVDEIIERTEVTLKVEGDVKTMDAK